MELLKCPKCGSSRTVKNGRVGDRPRRKCQECQHQYSRIEKRGKPLSVVHTAVILYLFGLSMRSIGRLLSVSAPAVLHWIKWAGKTMGSKPTPNGTEAVVLELDEMWHFIEKKVRSYGFGKPTTDPLIVCLTGNAAIVMGKRSKSYSID